MLHLHQSNDLPRLADALIQQLQAPTTGALAAQTILVQNPGMKRWLQQRISSAVGIAANLDFPLPSRFVWDLCLRNHDRGDTLRLYDAEVLRWRLLSLLNQQRHASVLTPLLRNTQHDPQGVARWQLADKIGALFDQYQVYRPDMIARWEAGEADTATPESWQAELWRQLRRQRPEPHRAQLIRRLLAELDSSAPPGVPDRLHVFALSALSPLYLDVLMALSNHSDIHLYYQNPSRHYWGDVQSRREQLNDQQQPVVDNELLASLGQQGREFIDQIYRADQPLQDHWYFGSIEPTSLLRRLQHDILDLQPSESIQDFSGDRSIRVVSCYSELRELQVLHDYLLERLAQDDELQPHDIVVMCPDINALSPFIDAVFDEQPASRRLPYNISDQNPLTASPLVQAVLDWLQLPNRRLTASEVLGWLELPALQRRFELDDQRIETIRFWIINNRIHWGLSGDFKQQLGFANTDINTWQFGIDRLLAAYLMHDDEPMFAGKPVSEVVMSQADLDILARLQRLLDTLRHWSLELAESATVETWQQRINDLIDQLLDLSSDEEWLLRAVRDELADWQQQAALAQFKDRLEPELVHSMLQQSMQHGAAGHPYLAGAITFCNLIPMRSLPFRVVCLIGMDGERFPREDVPLQFDLIARQPRSGDRSRREDDRYLFLQSLLSAQDAFYVSYAGRDRQDDSEIQPSVVVDELINTIEQSTGHKLDIAQTPLQFFSEQNFAAGSFAAQWQVSDDAAHDSGVFSQPVAAAEVETEIELDQLISFYRNPARHFMQRRLNMVLDEFENDITDDECFTLDPLDRYQINEELLATLLGQQPIEPARYLASGRLAEQSGGEIQLQSQLNSMSSLRDYIVTHADYRGLQRYDDQLHINGIDIVGSVTSYGASGLLLPGLSLPAGRHLFAMWIRYCFLSAVGDAQYAELRYLNRGQKRYKRFSGLTRNDAIDELTRLLNLYAAGQQSCLPFYVDTAYQYELEKQKHGQAAALQKIETLWRSDSSHSFFEALDPYLQTSLKGLQAQSGPFSEAFFELSEQLMTPLLRAEERSR